MRNIWLRARWAAMLGNALLERAHRAESGQVVVLFVPVLLFFAVAGYMVVDVGVAFSARRQIQRTVDIMALAGAQELPGDPAGARARATEWAARNGIASPPYTIEVTTDNTCYNTDPLDDPTKVDSITIRVVRPADRFFADVFSTSAITVGAGAKACWGGPTVPLDVAIIIDRSSSMSAADLTNAKDAANSILTLYDPAMQHLALGVLGPSQYTPTCANGGIGKPSPSAGSGTWLPVPLSSNYKMAGGGLNNASQLVKTISCLEHSSVGTNLAQPINFAKTHLQTAGRAGVKQGIIFMTDGAANDSGSTPCKLARDAAAAAKAAGIEVFVVAFGVQNDRCVDDSSGPYQNQWVTTLLADMATDSLDDHNHCQSAADVAAENADGDHLLCSPRAGDLTPVFQQAAKALAGITLVE